VPFTIAAPTAATPFKTALAGVLLDAATELVGIAVDDATDDATKLLAMEEAGTLDGAALDNAVLDGAAELIAALDGAMLLGASLLATAEETLLEEDDEFFLSSSPPQPTNNMAINIAVNLPGLTLIVHFPFLNR
jgi:hypothetical protein